MRDQAGEDRSEGWGRHGAREVDAARDRLHDEVVLDAEERREEGAGGGGDVRGADAALLFAAEKAASSARKVSVAVATSTRQCQRLIDHLAACRWDALVSDKKLTDLRPNHFMELQDYKMKLLQVWFREATTRWYGKRGISGHTSMITFAAAV